MTTLGRHWWKDLKGRMILSEDQSRHVVDAFELLQSVRTEVGTLTCLEAIDRMLDRGEVPLQAWGPEGAPPDRTGRWQCDTRIRPEGASYILKVTYRHEHGVLWMKDAGGLCVPVDAVDHRGRRYRRIGDVDE